MTKLIWKILKRLFQHLELVGEAEDTSTQVHSRDENTHFEKKIEELKAGFTSQFARERRRVFERPSGNNWCVQFHR